MITMDGDLQNDPSDIVRMVEEIRGGYDVICGWRKHRKDPLLRKRVPSRVFNWFSRKISGRNLHDFGTPFKAYRREIVKSISSSVYGELHRYIPVLAAWKGYKVSEVEVTHNPREHGKTKYGGGRLIRGFLDLFTVYFLEKYLSRPMHLFGTFGILSAVLGIVIGGYLAILRIFFGVGISDRPLLLLAILMVIFGLQFITLGLLGEMLTKYRYETGKSRFYDVEAWVNFELKE